MSPTYDKEVTPVFGCLDLLAVCLASNLPRHLGTCKPLLAIYKPWRAQSQVAGLACIEQSAQAASYLTTPSLGDPMPGLMQGVL